MIDFDYIKKMKQKGQKDLERFQADRSNAAILKSFNENGQEPGFNGATFLYIRAYEGDVGARPVPGGVCYWLSPDIEIYRNGILVDTSHPLQPDAAYVARVTVRNDGDLDCSSCMVDLCITRPSIGLKNKNLLNIGLANTAVAAHSFSNVDFPFITTMEMCGHKCMFARAYSLTTNDYPADFEYFQSKEDRHIAQQNLNIVQQGKEVDFQIVAGRLAGTKAVEIHLTRHKKSFTKDPVIQKKYNLQTRKAIPMEAFEIKEIKTERGKTQNYAKKATPGGKKHDKAVDQRIVLKDVRRLSKYRWIHPFEEESRQMKIKVPFMGLQGNEAVPLELIAKDPETGMLIGGITLLVVS